MRWQSILAAVTLVLAANAATAGDTTSWTPAPKTANAPFSPAPTQNGAKGDCYCTGTYGERVEVGDHACLVVNGRPLTALCDMSLNNPAWRIQHEGCPIT